MVTVSSGRLIGTRGPGWERYLGIPYGLPPFAERRFAPPVPAEAWQDARVADAHGPAAPQSPYRGAIAGILTSVVIPGDDILTLNVWAPEHASGAPVMLWLHGGALERGTAALEVYDGAPFARDGVVFVSVNYRLGAEGFSVLEDAPRNLGLEDVAAAFAWVRREIAAFGGDPERITLAGESAGGALVAALLTRPEVAAAVAGAIVQSGPLIAEPPRRAGRVTRAMAKVLGRPATKASFAGATPDELLEARTTQSRGGSPLSGTPGYTLCIDQDTLPRAARAALPEVAVPLLIGTNTDEYRLWFDPAALARVGPLRLRLTALALGVSGRRLRAYRAAWPDASPGELLGQVLTDRVLRADAIAVARTRPAPTWVYEFAWPSPVRELRAAHALELGFMFDALASEDARRMAGEQAPQALAEQMHGDWVRFVSTGDPGWSVFSDAERVRRYDEETTDVPLPRAEVLAAPERRASGSS